MKNTKVEKNTVKIPYVFVESYLDNLDYNYFKKKIDDGIVDPNNESFKTNVIGSMTPWKYFNNDKKFLETLFPIMDYMDFNLNPLDYHLENSWGLREGWGDYTVYHKHGTVYFSAVIYLNDHNSNLYFPELKKKVPIKKGKLVLFSSFLTHGTKRNIIKDLKYAIGFNFKYKNL